MLGTRRIEQINRTLTGLAGTVRGMHFQTGTAAETKIITCLRGRVFDVALDLRKGSPTFLKWHGVNLSGDVPLTLVIPEGVAHGFQTLTDNCAMLYLHTARYNAQAQSGVNALDPSFQIHWPRAITQMSDKDRSHPSIDSVFAGL